MVTVVLQPFSALLALFTAIHHTADAPDRRRRNLNGIADRRHPANDFMARHAGIQRPGPFRSRLMEIGMADAAVCSDLYILWAGFAAGDDIDSSGWLAEYVPIALICIALPLVQ